MLRSKINCPTIYILALSLFYRKDIIRCSPPGRRDNGPDDHQLIAPALVAAVTATTDTLSPTQHNRDSAEAANRKVSTELQLELSSSDPPQELASEQQVSCEGHSTRNNEEEKAVSSGAPPLLPSSGPDVLMFNNSLSPTASPCLEDGVEGNSRSSRGCVSLEANPQEDGSNIKVIQEVQVSTSEVVIGLEDPQPFLTLTLEQSEAKIESTKQAEVNVESTIQLESTTESKFTLESSQKPQQQNAIIQTKQLSESSKEVDDSWKSMQQSMPSKESAQHTNDIQESSEQLPTKEEGRQPGNGTKLSSCPHLDSAKEMTNVSCFVMNEDDLGQSIAVMDAVLQSQEDVAATLSPASSGRRESSVLPAGLRLSPVSNGKLLEAAHAVSAEFSHVLEQVTQTASPIPPPRSSLVGNVTGLVEPVTMRLLPTPPPPPSPPLPPEDPEERCSLPSPPPEARQEATPPRPLPPRAPAPPERSCSHSRLSSSNNNSTNNSCNNTPTTQRRRIVVRAVKTPSPLPFLLPPQPSVEQVSSDYRVFLHHLNLLNFALYKD